MTTLETTRRISLEPILGTLDAEQRAAAVLPDGPAQIIAPAGSGKTTTMVARLAVLLSRGVAPDRICVVTFNRDAALDLAAGVARRRGPQVPAATTIEIRTLHALARRRHGGGCIGPPAGGVAARHVAVGLEGGGAPTAV